MSNPLQFQVNHQEHVADCAPGTSLLTLLRHQGWAGVHRVCESGDCGSCTVWVEGQPIHSCIYPAQRIGGLHVTTVEGLAHGDQLSPMQAGFLEKQGFQCGYCTPGMIMTAEKLGAETEAEIRRALDGNLCRCTGYEAIVESILAGQQGTIDPKVAEPPCSASPVGQSIPKQDGPDIVTGKPIYTADWSPSGLLHLKVVRSPHAHARILSIDTREAKALPGVQAIFTHEDVPRRPYSTAGHGAPVPDPHDHYLLDNKVRFVGDRVAAVVADSEAIAERACQLIEVEYEILPHVINPVAAIGRYWDKPAMGNRPEGILSGDPPLIHDEPDSFQIHDAQHNVAGEVLLNKGDLEAGFAEADLLFDQTYDLPAVQHFHLEPHVTISWLEADGTLTLRSSTQVPFHCQRLLSELLELPIDRIRVFKVNMGGGFGNKQEILTEDLCAFATLKTGRPVQWQFTRQEEFTATNSRHAMQIHLKIGVKRDGTLTAIDMRAIANTGAYGNHGTQVVFLTGAMPLGMYRCPNQRFLGLSVYTNTMPAGAFRGYGATQGVFAVESQLDDIAQTLKLDPIALRRQHLITAKDELLIGHDHHFHLVGSCGLEEALQQVTAAIAYQPGMPPRVDGSLRRGVGFAVAMQGSGLAKIHLAQVKLTLQPNGRYELRTGSVDVGTGSNTTLRQIAAAELNTTVDQIDLVSADTHETPFDAGSYASATLYISGQAVKLAAEQLRSRLLTHAAAFLDGSVDDLTLRGHEIVGWDHPLAEPTPSDPTLPAPRLDISTFIQKADIQGEPFAVEAEYAANESTLTFAVQGVEVEVDTETGRVTVLKCVQAIDIGKAINPRICRGQATGGIVMGIGYALQEELRFDAQGKILNPSPRTYRLPLAKDVPPIEIIMVEQADPYGPYGAKGVGEIGTNCTAPAIANAIAHATGVRLRQLPMTPERVWEALQTQAAEQFQSNPDLNPQPDAVGL